MVNLLKSNKKREKDLTKARDNKCEPVAREIIQIIARHNLDPKNVNHEEKIKIYGPLQVEINQLMKEKELTISEVNYTWSIVQVVLDNIKSLSVNSIQMAFDHLESKVFGVDNMNDITLQKIDDMLLLN
jgi:ribosome maturation protein Sdo1